VFANPAATAALVGSLLIGGANSAVAAPDSSAAAAADAQRSGVTPNSKLDPTIRVNEEENKIGVVLRGSGKQVYDCTDGVWKLREPVATLSTLRGAPVGIHGVGPFWASFDGSRVNGSAAVTSPQPPPPPASRNVAWLKLVGSSVGTGGVFSKITFIQRIDTKGGATPTSGCTGTATIAVDYSTIYVFWTKK
jgi:hypothetical protein